MPASGAALYAGLGRRCRCPHRPPPPPSSHHHTRWINSFADRLYYRHLHGDKDTFPLAFAAAGKAHCYSQVHTPPGERYGWRRGHEVTAPGARESQPGLCPQTREVADVGHQARMDKLYGICVDQGFPYVRAMPLQPLVMASRPTRFPQPLLQAACSSGARGP